MDNIRLLYIDLFCGAGGTSTGVEKANYKERKCAKVIACVNHDANAIASHAANHPEAQHYTEDMRTLDLRPLAEHTAEMRRMYPMAKVVLWASLECTNFSRAKGGQPRDADSRTLAEHLFRYIEALTPDYIQIENVEEFMSWGDLDENGKPISRDKGRLYTNWVDNVKAYGYKFDHRILNAADYGAYTSRKRFFGIFAKPYLPIVWPKPTHPKTGGGDLFGSLAKWKPVKEVLDFADEGESIFNRKKPLSPKTLERIYAGLIKFVAGGKDSFLIKYNSVNKKTGKHIPPSIDEPCPTVACQNRLGIANIHFLAKHFSGHPESKVSSVDNVAGTITTVDHHSLVGAEFLSAYYGNGNNHSVNMPSPTITPKDRFSVVKPEFIANNYSGGGQLSSLDNPCPAVMTNPKQNVIACKWYLMNPQFSNAGGSVEKPCFTLIAKMEKKKKVVIGMSGGVDSSVAAYLLKEQGYDVIGVTMQIWQEDKEYTEREGGCCSLSAVDDARRVANKIGIPFYVMNFRDSFKEKVIDYFVQEYIDVKTPNPCIACNKHLKFDELLRKTQGICLVFSIII